MKKFDVNLSIDYQGKKRCVFCKKEFAFPDIAWDGKDIEFNNSTLWLDSLCSRTCSIGHKQKAAKEDFDVSIESVLFKNGVPKFYLHCSFDNFKIETPNHARAVDCLKKLKIPFKRSVLLFGNCGTGKTHLAIAAMRKIILDTKKTSPLFVSALKLIKEIRVANFAENGPNETEIIDKYTADALLVIDDIGVEKQSEFVAQCWYSIIDARTANNLPTIYTSNLGKTEVEEKLGPRIASRLFACTVIPIDGKDKRETRSD